MKYAADFRSLARDALRGKWIMAVVAGLIASLLGGLQSSNGVNFNLNIENNEITMGSSALRQQFSGLFDQWENIFSQLDFRINGFLLGAAGVLVLVGLVFGIAYFILGSVVGLGYTKFNLVLVDRQKEPELGALFGYFPHWKRAALTYLLQGVYTFLWSLLLIIPGIIATYSYAMTKYILAENPELTANEAIGRSKEMMDGNRWRLFCLEISFIGWDILCLFTLGIGHLWLTPYKQAARAAFYRDISGTACIPPQMD